MNELNPAEAFNRTFIQAGWSRVLPVAAIELAPMIAFDGPLSRAEIDAILRDRNPQDEGLDSTAWEPLRLWTDDELRELRDGFADTPLQERDSEPETAEAVMADEAAERQRAIAELDTYSAALGVPPVRTMGDLLTFMIATTLVRSTGEGTYELNPEAPLPEEALPIHPQRATSEDALRWAQIHETTAQAIIRLFRPNDRTRINSLDTSLAELTETTAESARAAIPLLLEEGDTASIDIATAADDEAFTLTVDWERFASSRISIQSATRD